MKRFAFWFIAGIAAVALIRSSHHRPYPRPAREVRTFVVRHEPTIRINDGDDVPKYVRIENNGKVITINGGSVTVTERGRDRDRDRDQDDADVNDDDRNELGRVVVDGLPVPIEPGTRVVDALPEPPRPPAPPKPPRSPRRPVSPKRPRPPASVLKVAEKAPEPVAISGRLSATEDRARTDARNILKKAVAKWVAPEVPTSWSVPDRAIDGLIREVHVTPHEPREKGELLGTMYDATLLVDLSKQQRNEIVRTYNRERAVGRLGMLGGGLAAALAVLATVSCYIRADEATKGYYTNKLRVIAAAGLGAAAVSAYRWMA